MGSDARPAGGGMTEILVVYASEHGQTAKISARIRETLHAAGALVDVRDIGAAAGLSPAAYDAVIVGASVHGGRHQHEVVEWARAHAVALNGMPSAFFSVSLGAAEETDESLAATREYIDDFLDDTGWTPDRTERVAGALQYREYDFPTRLVMRLLMSRGEHPTDWSHDYDYTDWDAVDRFAQEFAAMAAEAGHRRASRA